MIKFEGRNAQEFYVRFQTVESCKEYLASVKWKDGFECVKCKHTEYQMRKNLSRICNKCCHIESPGANTLFHKVKFGLDKAFIICFEMSTTTKSLSAKYISMRVGVKHRTARLFMHKVREAMKSSENHPMIDRVEVDEFVVGGEEEGKVGRSYDSKKKKAVTALELTSEGKVKRMYIKLIDDFSAKELRPIFDQHIDKSAKVTTDLWRGYRPIMKDYKIDQIPSGKGKNFKILHHMIHQVKSWIRTTYSYVSESHIQRYFDEFCFRLNRSRSKKTIFHNLIARMVKAPKISHRQIIST
jgi:transposase-like protein